MMTYDVPGLPQSLIDIFSASPELPTPLPPEPFSLLTAWFKEGLAARATPNPDAMSLATLSPQGLPSVRIVLCRDINAPEGRLTFFTNYLGRKGRELDANRSAAACFHWDHADRQARVEGIVLRSPAAESDAYFQSRRWESRLSAWASAQSTPTSGRPELLQQMADAVSRLGLAPDQLASHGAEAVIPRPPHWGGFRLHAARVELWLGGPGRLHDRAEWVRDVQCRGEEVQAGNWTCTRLQP